MREVRPLRVTPIPKRSEAKLDTLKLGISSGVLTYSGKYVRFGGGECGVSSSLGGRSSGSYLLGNIFSPFSHGNLLTLSTTHTLCHLLPALVRRRYRVSVPPLTSPPFENKSRKTNRNCQDSGAVATEVPLIRRPMECALRL